MQPSDSLYIDDFNLEPLQMSSQLQLPDMDALRLSRARSVSSPPGGQGQIVHHLMIPHQGGLPPGPAPPHNIQEMNDPLRLMPTPVSTPHSIGPPSQTHHTLTTMKYPGTPPDTPPGSCRYLYTEPYHQILTYCCSSPSPPYHLSTTVTTANTIGLTEVTELVWRGYNQDQALDLRGQTCDPTKLGEGTWLRWGTLLY